MELQGKIIHFLGDSITQGYGPSAPDKVYHQLIKQKYGLAEANNFGIGGTCLADRYTPLEIPEFNAHFITRVKDMPEKADAIVVFGGTNDFGHGEVALGDMNDRTIHTFYGAMHALCLLLIEKYIGKTIVFMTPLHRLHEDTATNVSKFDGISAHPLIDYVKAIREVCEYYSLPVLDLYANSGMSGNVPAYCEKFIPDGLHPNDAGHRIIADKLRRFLEAL